MSATRSKLVIERGTATIPSGFRDALKALSGRTYSLNQDVLTRVWMERLRQKELLKAGKIKFDLASPVVSKDRKLRVITEENGEVARAIDLLENAESTHKILAAKEHLREELNQLVACGIAWLEAIEEELKS